MSRSARLSGSPSTSAARERDHDSLVVFSKEDPARRGSSATWCSTLEPARDAGKRVLLDGHSLWFYDPNSKASVRISAQQRLIGQAAIGDILTVNLAADYTASLVGTETLEDASRQPRKCWHLELKAANDLATYSRVEYWVEQGTFYPDQGQVLLRQRAAPQDRLFPQVRRAARRGAAHRGDHHRRGGLDACDHGRLR